MIKQTHIKFTRLALSFCIASTIAACSTLPGGLPNAQSVVQKGAAGEVLGEDAALDNVDKGLGKIVKSVTNIANDTINSIKKGIDKFNDGVTDVGQTALDETVEFAEDLAAELEDLVALLTNFCSFVEGKIEKWALFPPSLKDLFNPMSACGPQKDDNGYFLFGKEGGGGLPVYQNTMYLSIKSGSKKIKASLLPNKRSSGLDNVASVTKDLFKAVGIPSLDDLYSTIEKEIGPFAFAATYNPREGWYLYVLHDKGDNSKVKNNNTVQTTVNQLKNLINKFSTAKVKDIKYGKSVSTEHKGGLMNFTMLYYLIGSHAAKFDKV